MRVFYLRDEKGFPVACVATDKVSATDIKYAVSTWNPMDVFDKKRGREIAEGRLRKAKSNLLSLGLAITGNVKTVLLMALEADPEIPERARSAARYQLTKRT